MAKSNWWSRRWGSGVDSGHPDLPGPMLERLREIHEEDWAEADRPRVIGLSALFALAIVVLLRSPEGWLPLVDDANLAFHEAGHPILGAFGETLGLWGGTLFQLLVPVAVAGSFWARRDPVGTAAGGFWFGENLLNVARYMADARAQLLPLVGGGEHDWANILGSWGVLSWDTRLAGVVRLLGWAAMIGSWTWLWMRQRAAR